jgi:hypothetical protein
MKYCRHKRPAVVIPSAEAWHESFEWTNGLQDRAFKVLRSPISFEKAPDWCCTIFDTSCKKDSLCYPPQKVIPALNGSAKTNLVMPFCGLAQLWPLRLS